MANKIQLRRDTASNWSRINPILADGEPGLDITNNKVKMGDGNTAWSSLPFLSSSEHSRLINGNKVLSVASSGAVTVPGTITFPSGATNNGSTVITSGVYDIQSIGNTLIQTSANAGAKTWTFDTGGNLTLPDPSKILANAQDKDVVIETHDVSSTYDWVLGGNGITTVPGRIQGRTGPVTTDNVQNIEAFLGQGGNNSFLWLSGANFFTLYNNYGQAAVGWKFWGTGGEANKATIIAIDTALGGPTIHLDGPLYGNAPYTAAHIINVTDPVVLGTGGANRWYFNTDGSLNVPSGGVVNVKGAVPLHSYGEAGDVVGMTAYDGNYFYYCKQNYVDNLTNIWVRSAWTGTNW